MIISTSEDNAVKAWQGAKELNVKVSRGVQVWWGWGSGVLTDLDFFGLQVQLEVGVLIPLLLHLHLLQYLCCSLLLFCIGSL